jgi:CubicO group peptidase (beta-lactamase class C family)
MTALKCFFWLFAITTLSLAGLASAQSCSITTYDANTRNVILPCLRMGTTQLSAKLDFVSHTKLGESTPQGLYWKWDLAHVEPSPCQPDYPACATLDETLTLTIRIEINGTEQTAYLEHYPQLPGLYWRYAGLKSQEDAKFAQLLGFMENAMNDNNVPGGAIAIITHGKISNAAGVGVKREGENDPVNVGTLFYTASMSKMLTAGAVMTLVDEGLVDLNAPVTDYVPYFQLMSPHDPSHVTVHHLLTHTAGFPDDAIQECDSDPNALSGWFRENTEQPLWSPPGRLFNYSNPGYSLLGLLVEEISGLPFAEAMQQRIFEPVGMTSATYDPSYVYASNNYAVGHNVAQRGVYPDYVMPDSMVCATERPSGGLTFASVLDMAHYGKMLLAQGSDVLTVGAVKKMTTGHIESSLMLPDDKYGYGLIGLDYKNNPVISHGGVLPGFLTEMWLVPSHHFGVVIMLNSDTYSPAAIAMKAIDIYLNFPDTPPPDYSTPPQTWNIYTGIYEDPNTFGEFTVYQDSENRLWVGIMEEGEFETTELIQMGGHRFVFELEEGEPPLMMNFVLDEHGQAEYFVTRVGVGKRVEK